MPEWHEVLAVLREIRGWGQKELAAVVHVRPDTISHYERGIKPLSRPTLERLVAAMGYPPYAIDRTVSYLRGLPRPGAAPAGAAEDPERQLDEIAAGLGFEVEDFVRSLWTRISGEARALAEREIARSLWFRLRRHPHPARLALVEEGEEFWSPALSKLLCDESVRAAADDADQAVELAELAVAVARLVPGSESRRSQFQGRALAFLGNGLRVRGQLPAASEAFARSHELRPAEADSPDFDARDEVQLLSLESSLRRDQRLLPEALALLDQALEADRDGAAKGRLLIKRAKTLEELGSYDEAVSTLQQALPLVDGKSDPRLPLVLRFNLLENLHHVGRSAEAFEMLPEVRQLALGLGNALDLIRLTWLEGRLAAAISLMEEALAALEQVRGELVARGIAYDTALVTLEKAALLLEAGRTAEVKELAAMTARIFRAQGVEREALASLWVFCEAAEKGALTVERLHGLLAELRDAKHEKRRRVGLHSDPADDL